MNQEVGQVKAAKHIFLSVSRFNELVIQGVIPKTKAGKFDLDIVREKAFAHLRRDKGGHGTADLSKQRSELAQEQTLAVRFKNAIARGDYVSLENFARRVDAMLTVVRERVLSVAGKVSHYAEMRTREEIDAIFREELYEALNELSNPAYVGGRGDRRPTSTVAPAASPAAKAHPDRMG